MRNEQEHIAFNDVHDAINRALGRYAERLHLAIMSTPLAAELAAADLAAAVEAQTKIRVYAEADDDTMSRLGDVCDQVDNRTRFTARPRGEAVVAALELVRAGVSMEEIIDTHLTAAEQVADVLHCTLVEAALLVAQASAQFRLNAGSVQHLPGFVKLVKDT
jgi:hypothetical protein